MSEEDSSTMHIARIGGMEGSGGNILLLKDLLNKLFDLRDNFDEMASEESIAQYQNLLAKLNEVMSYKKNVNFMATTPEKRAQTIACLSISLTPFVNFQENLNGFVGYIIKKGFEERDSFIKLSYPLRVDCGNLLNQIHGDSSFSNSFIERNFEDRVVFNLNNLKTLIQEIYDSLEEFSNLSKENVSAFYRLIKLLREDQVLLARIIKFLLSKGFLVEEDRNNFLKDFSVFLKDFKIYLMNRSRFKAFRAIERDVEQLKVIHDAMVPGLKGLDLAQSTPLVQGLHDLHLNLARFPLGWHIILSDLRYFDDWYNDFVEGADPKSLARIIVLCLNLESLLNSVQQMNLYIDIYYNSSIVYVIRVLVSRGNGLFREYNNFAVELGEDRSKNSMNKVFKKNYKLNKRVDPLLFFIWVNEANIYLSWISKHYRLLKTLNSSFLKLEGSATFLLSEHTCSNALRKELLNLLHSTASHLEDFTYNFEENEDKIVLFVKIRNELIDLWGANYERFDLNNERDVYQLNNFEVQLEDCLDNHLRFDLDWDILVGTVLDSLNEQANLFNRKLDTLLIQLAERHLEGPRLMNVIR